MAMMFRGIQEINIDVKGRMAIPSRYRSILLEEAKGQLVLTIDTEQRCLMLYPLSTWEIIEKKLSELPSFHPATRRIQRLTIGHAFESNLDKQGRLLLPPLLREYADIKGTVVLIGQGNRFEIWSKETWCVSRERWINESSALDGGVPDELRSISL